MAAALQPGRVFALVRGVFLHRALMTGIVLFWLVMTGLLLRVELFPDESKLLPVPIEHIVKLIFLHQQPSDLVLFHQKQRLGNVHFQPQRVKDPEHPERGFIDILGATGAIAVKLPEIPPSRATFRFTCELSEKQEMRRFDCSVTLHTPKQTPQQPDSNWSLQFDGRPPLDQFHYAVRKGDAAVKEATGTMAALLADPELSVFGFDPRMILAQAETSAREPSMRSRMVFNAHRGSLRFNTEELETFVISARFADSLESTIHVSQLGQVLAVKTFLDYDLYDEALSP